MPVDFSRDIFFLLCAALTGGILARLSKLQPVVGYLVAGIVFRLVLPGALPDMAQVANLGLLFLLFTVGLELSISKLRRVFRVSLLSASLQMFSVSITLYLLMRLLGLGSTPSIILALGFSLSSTAIVVKTLIDKGETETLHGEVMVGWLIVQDLAVIPIMIVLGNLRGGIGAGLFGDIVRIVLALGVIVVLSRFVIPLATRFIASLNLRELTVIGSVLFAIGVALVVSLFGVSPAIGAFIAGIVIANTEEKHVVFAEVRPLRDLFVGIFFVSLGLLISPAILGEGIGIIVGLTLLVVLVKLAVNFMICLVFKYHGRIAASVALGLSQVGEFSFIIFVFSQRAGLISERVLTIGLSVALLSLTISPILYGKAVPFWDLLRRVFSRFPGIGRRIFDGNADGEGNNKSVENHIVICGYGRVGRWVGKAVDNLKVPYVVVEFDRSVVRQLKMSGAPVVYGDPTEKEILEAANLKKAKAVVVAIPDRLTQEAVIAQLQTLAPRIKIISRVNDDEEWERLKVLKIQKIVQPEFEAAVAIIRSILISMGKSSDEVKQTIRSIRGSRAASL